MNFDVIHTPRYQNGSGGKFIVCSCDAWRSGVGDHAYVRQQFADHLRTVTPPKSQYERSADV